MTVRIIALMLTLNFAGLFVAADETPRQAALRHQRVKERRDAVHLICHRGAVEFAQENTLEAYRAALELGGDGNEIDIRSTKDGVLVCFHDDMIDHLLQGYGDVAELEWTELQKLPFRDPGRFGKHCRIPTLREVFELHRDYHGLLFLDIKRAGLTEAIGKLLNELDMWDHVVHAPSEFTDSRIQRTRHKAEMYLERTEVDDSAIAEMLKSPGERVLLEYPQKVAVALGRIPGTPSTQPVRSEIAVWAMPRQPAPDSRSLTELLEVIQQADDWNQVAPAGLAAVASAERILRRAQAADEVSRRGVGSEEVYFVLERRVRQRSMHRDWQVCGLDGAAALRALIALKAPRSAEVARFCLWRDDPLIEAAKNPTYVNPRSWTDFRTKIPVFKLLESLPGPETEAICRDYLALSDEEARQIGILVFEDAARCLIAVNSIGATLQELRSHRLSVVRGRAQLAALRSFE